MHVIFFITVYHCSHDLLCSFASFFPKLQGLVLVVVVYYFWSVVFGRPIGAGLGGC